MADKCHSTKWNTTTTTKKRRAGEGPLTRSRREEFFPPHSCRICLHVPFLKGRGKSPFLLLAFSGSCFYISILSWFWKPLYRFIYVYLPSLVMVFLTKYTLSLNYSIHKK